MNDVGIIAMTMWYGNYREAFYEDDLCFVYYNKLTDYSAFTVFFNLYENMIL